MEQLNQLEQKNVLLEQKIDKLQHSIDRLNKILLWMLIITVGMVIIPLIGIMFIVPQLLSSYGGMMQGL